MPIPWEASIESPAQTQLEEALRGLLKSATGASGARQAIDRFLSPGIEQLPWIIEDEEEPPAPYGKIRQASQARFGNGSAIMRRDAQGRQFEEQWWRVAVEVVVDNAASTATTTVIGQTPARLTAILSHILSQLFSTPAGRAQLEELGIYNVRDVPEGDKAAGALFNFDVQVDVYAEPELAGVPA